MSERSDSSDLEARLAAAPERNIARIPEVIYQLEEVWKRESPLRLTQLMWSLCAGPGESAPVFFNTDDDVLLQRLLERLKGEPT